MSGQVLFKHMQVQNAGGNQAELERLIRQSCDNTCVTKVLPQCPSTDEVDPHVIEQGYD